MNGLCYAEIAALIVLAGYPDGKQTTERGVRGSIMRMYNKIRSDEHRIGAQEGMLRVDRVWSKGVPQYGVYLFLGHVEAEVE